MWKSYLRWRHSKGFGVHSPYAYTFITDVLRPGQYGFYAYDQLESLSRGLNKGNHNFYRDAKFLIRLSIFLHVKRIITWGVKYPEAQIAAKALRLTYFNCDSKTDILFKPGDLLILPSRDADAASIVEKALQNQVPLYSINPSPEIRQILESPIDHGVLFSGRSKILLIPRSEMDYVAYNIKF